MAYLRIRGAGQEREDMSEPVVAKRVVNRVVEIKDNQYKELKRTMLEKQQTIELMLQQELKKRIFLEFDLHKSTDLNKMLLILSGVSMIGNLCLML